ncbi:hypothetical protein ATCV1_z709R [Acanthocystis turfacea chlorella virus 1]|uniref:Uncharacterized protein z709R n=1 Tax=Chlorovirus heliozoae TaxID=322019 RepID=A7K9W9_9PHYC|nr:hypothetical protein ATCV1_z709R [Acanthocystis turfacea chlorella virus 1]ABT16843.1 hypothetical protein ATCV1_z709R [Acanthocystis turfacea chlorella virus 1]
MSFLKILNVVFQRHSSCRGHYRHTRVLLGTPEGEAHVKLGDELGNATRTSCVWDFVAMSGGQFLVDDIFPGNFSKELVIGVLLLLRDNLHNDLRPDVRELVKNFRTALVETFLQCNFQFRRDCHQIHLSVHTGPDELSPETARAKCRRARHGSHLVNPFPRWDGKVLHLSGPFRYCV